MKLFTNALSLIPGSSAKALYWRLRIRDARKLAGKIENTEDRKKSYKEFFDKTANPIALVSFGYENEPGRKTLKEYDKKIQVLQQKLRDEKRSIKDGLQDLRVTHPQVADRLFSNLRVMVSLQTLGILEQIPGFG